MIKNSKISIQQRNLNELKCNSLKYLKSQNRSNKIQQKIEIQRIKINQELDEAFDELRIVLSELSVKELEILNRKSNLSKSSSRNPKIDLKCYKTFSIDCSSNNFKLSKSDQVLETAKNQSKMKLVQTGPFSFEIRQTKRNLEKENFENFPNLKRQKFSNSDKNFVSNYSENCQNTKRENSPNFEIDFSLKPKLSSTSTTSDLSESSGFESQTSEMSIDENLLNNFHYPDFNGPLTAVNQKNESNKNLERPKKAQNQEISTNAKTESKLSAKAQLFSISSILSTSSTQKIEQTTKISLGSKNSTFQPNLNSNQQPGGSDIKKKGNKILLEDGRKIFRCNFCSKTFTNNSNWRRHENLHGRGRIQECPICMKTFMQKEYLKKHMMTHSRDRKNFIG